MHWVDWYPFRITPHCVNCSPLYHPSNAPVPDDATANYCSCSAEWDASRDPWFCDRCAQAYGEGMREEIENSLREDSWPEIDDTDDINELVDPGRRDRNGCRCAFFTLNGCSDSDSDGGDSCGTYERGGFWSYNEIINSFPVDTWVSTTDVSSHIPSLNRVVGAFRNTAMFRRCMVCDGHVPFDRISRKMLDTAWWSPEVEDDHNEGGYTMNDATVEAA
jgi:hypothetical protein